MGMLDFLKRDPEDDYDDLDDDLLDEEFDEEPEDEPKAPRLLKGKKPLLRFTKEEEEETIALTAKAGSRFSEDYKTYLFAQAEQANENLRRRTAEAYELVRQAAGQPPLEGYDSSVHPVLEEAEASVFDSEDDVYIPGADEEDASFGSDFDDDLDDYDDHPDFGEFTDDDDLESF